MQRQKTLSKLISFSHVYGINFLIGNIFLYRQRSLVHSKPWSVRNKSQWNLFGSKYYGSIQIACLMQYQPTYYIFWKNSMWKYIFAMRDSLKGEPTICLLLLWYVILVFHLNKIKPCNYLSKYAFRKTIHMELLRLISFYILGYKYLGQYGFWYWVMTYCQTVASFYLKQWWLFINTVQWNSRRYFHKIFLSYQSLRLTWRLLKCLTLIQEYLA